jgi:hypothetical protein
MARTTKAALEAQVAELTKERDTLAQLFRGAELYIAELEGELEATKAPAPVPAPAPKLAAAPAPTPATGIFQNKNGAASAARNAAILLKRCTRVVHCTDGTFSWEFYGRKAA